ncbi:hypothetical protein NBRC116586_25440 [Pseudooceanicola nitratireducens]|uniref:ArnT family glycosyltransferase n=1 Tax=Pseudooceanicola nitratireducens TaxID=517719 RepID=UPI003109FE58
MTEAPGAIRPDHSAPHDGLLSAQSDRPQADGTPGTGAPGWSRVYGLAVLMIVGLGLYSLGEPFGRDQGIHSTIAYAWTEGLTPYRDVYNIKPPFTTVMHALSQVLFGAQTQAIRLLDWIAVAASVLGLVRVLQMLGRSRAEAGFAALGFALIYYSLTYWEHAQTDGWAGMMVIPSLLCLLSGWRRAGRARLGWMLAAGALLGVGVGFKYTIAAAGLLVFAPLISGGPALRFRLTDLLAYVAGGALVLGLTGLVLARAGALGPFLEIQDYIRGYIAYGSDSAAPLRGVTVLFTLVPLVGWITLLGLLPWLAALMRGESLFVAITAIWGVTAFVSGQVQGKGFAYHFMPLIPIYAVLFGLFLAALHGALMRRVTSTVGARMLIGLAVIWMVVTSPISGRSLQSFTLWLRQAPLTAYHASYPMPPDFDILAVNDFAATLARHRAPGDRLFVWGYETMLYLLAQEPPRYRYAYAWPFVVDFHDGRYSDDLMHRLRAAPPKHVVLQDGDATPWVTGRPESSLEFLAKFEDLNAFLTESYEVIETTERFRLLERRD